VGAVLAEDQLEMALPRVSWIVPCYNVASTVTRSVESILAQCFQNWECILVNDGSSDSTGRILSQLAERDPRLRVVERHCNKGLVYSLNEGIGAASADLFARLDGDDEALPDRLGLQLDFMRQHPDVDVCGGAAIYVSPDGHEAVVGMPLSHDEIAAEIFRRCPLIHPSVVFRRRFITRAGGYDERRRRMEDYDLWLRTYRWARFANLPQPLIRYNFKHKDSLAVVVRRTMMLLGSAKREGRREVWVPIVARAAIGLAVAATVSERWLLRRWGRV
jgi:glycosyltransferase involved in cell wall biosynthesis